MQQKTKRNCPYSMIGLEIFDGLGEEEEEKGLPSSARE